MGTFALRPPLPAPLSHEQVPFVLDLSNGMGVLSPQTVAAIAAALTALLPAGDLLVDQHGHLLSPHAEAPTGAASSLWYQAGLLAGIERSSL